MLWNWQHKNWPNFSFHHSDFSELEKEFLHNAGMLSGSMKHIHTDQQENFRIELISSEAFKTSEIEGDILNRESLQSSIRKQFGLQDFRKIPPAEHGISEMMVDLYRHYQTPLSHELLYSWHNMLSLGRRDLKNVGKYRSHKDPMQIISGSAYEPSIHFEAPPSEMVVNEMTIFIDWFNESEKSMSALTRAAIAHLYFESIHPFEDGNGRIGRAISEKALSQHLGRPTLIALSFTIERNRREYYSALQRNSKGLEVTDWLTYFCHTALDAQANTQRLIDFLIEKTKFYQRHESSLNMRQQKAIQRIFQEGPEGFKGGLSAENYVNITGTTSSTATRDLQKLVSIGALYKTGELKGTRYWIKMP
jgi:Fic family protein